ncbi:MAG: dihydropteroate synthase [Bacteroidota bacterium]
MTNLSQQNERIEIMGILNVTPDSFSDGGKFDSVTQALDRIEEMIAEGASIIDVGGESTRPGSEPVSLEEELKRVVPVLEQALPAFGTKARFSIDTTKYEVAKAALKIGCTIVNDVSGLTKAPELADLSADFGATYVLMHSKGIPKTMQQNPEYVQIIAEVSSFFEQKIEVLASAGVSDIVLDPGIGFGKLLNHNIKLISELDSFSKFELPILVGASRKSMIHHLLDRLAPEDRVTGTVVLHYHALIKGARWLRVHDVKEAYDSVRIFQALN